jgi:hypothetical protein
MLVPKLWIKRELYHMLLMWKHSLGTRKNAFKTPATRHAQQSLTIEEILICACSSWHRQNFTNSCGAVVVVQHAAQALAALDHDCVSKMARFWDHDHRLLMDIQACHCAVS